MTQKSKMRNSRKTKMGKIRLPMDVRSSKDIPAFEDMLSGGPMAVVLVYADWCGHCDTYKKNVWSPLKNMKNRTLNLASVHHDQLENTSLQGSKIDGYPSILMVGKDKKPAVFNTNSGVTNAMPNTNEVSTMKKIITTPVSKEATGMNANSSFTPTINGEPIEEGTNISLPSIQSSLEPMNEREREILNDFRNNTKLYIPKNLNANAKNASAKNASANTSAKNASANASANTSAKNTVSANAKNANIPTTLNTANASPRIMNSLNTPMEPNSNNTAEFEKPATPSLTNVSPPNTEEDEVENSEVTNSPRLAPANNQGATPLNLKGGRLLRRLTRKARRSTKKQSKRKN
jgi:hypothetical protein